MNDTPYIIKCTKLDDPTEVSYVYNFNSIDFQVIQFEHRAKWFTCMSYLSEIKNFCESKGYMFECEAVTLSIVRSVVELSEL